MEQPCLNEVERGRPRTATPVRYSIIRKYVEGRRAEDIHKHLMHRAEWLGDKWTHGNLPKQRTVQNVIGDFRALSETVRLQEAPLDILHIEQAALPLQSLSILLEAHAEIISNNIARRRQPDETTVLPRVMTVRFARWLWWVHNADPAGRLGEKLEVVSFV